ncbi:MAG: hypothetical protein RLZZ500_2084 [Bacteroidota bacterium]|jgi:hypothetical protein
MPSNTIYDLFQDREGFMWMATSEGLCKYDGTKFTLFSSAEQTSKSGSNIAQDRFNRIWYINFDGYLYYVENNTLKPFVQKNSIGYYEFGILHDYLFTIQKGGIEIYDLKTLRRIKTLPLDTTQLKATHYSNDNFYLFTKELITINTQLNVDFQPLPDAIQTSKSIVVQSAGNQLYIASKINGELHSYANHQFELLAQFKESSIQNLSVIENKLWLATTSGLVSYHKGTFTPYFKNQNIATLFKDREQKYWVATLTNGLLYIPNFATLLLKSDTKPLTLRTSKNKVLIGYENDYITELHPENLNQAAIYKGNSNHEVYQLYQDGKTTFMTSNNFKVLTPQLTEINIALKDITRIEPDFYAFAASGVCGFISTQSPPNPWKTLYNQTVKDKNARFTITKLLTNVRGKAVSYNPENQTIYFATHLGIFCQSPSRLEKLEYNQKPIFTQKLFYALQEIYFLSHDAKILRIDRSNRIRPLTIPAIPASECIKSLKIINNGMYLFTSNAIFKHDLITKKTIKLLVITPDISISDLTALGTHTYLATSKGLIILPNSSFQEEKLPKFMLNAVRVNDKITTVKTLNYDENNISFDFSVLAYQPNTRFPIAYKINNGKWNYLDDQQRTLKLSSLAAGDYTLEFKIENLEKTKCNRISYHCTIQKPFWLSWHFVLLYCFMFSLLVLIFSKYHFKKIAQKNAIELNRIQLENNLNASKLTAIQSQMNPHFFYNALNTIQSYILTNDKKEAISYLNKFASLTRKILELTERSYVTLHEEVKTLTLYLDLEQARFNTDFSYEIYIEETLDSEGLMIPSLLIQPFVENAIKHGLLHCKGPKRVQLHFLKHDDFLQIVIDDNGIGRKRSEAINQHNRKDHISFATHAIDKRLEILNKNKLHKITVSYVDKVENDEPTGTTVYLNIPMTWK